MNAIANREPETAVTDYSEGMVGVFERALRDQTVEIDKLERLIALKERMDDREAERAFSEAKMAAQAEMPQIKRTGSNDQTKSSYAELDEIAAQIDPIVHKHGFSTSYGTADSPLENHYRVTCRLRHRGGFFEDYQADVPADTVGMKGNQNKTATHGFGSTMSYGRRYLKLMVWDVATTDDDGRAASSGALIDFSNLETLKARCSQVGGDEALFAKALKVPSLAMLPSARFREAMSMLDAKEQKAAIERHGK